MADLYDILFAPDDQQAQAQAQQMAAALRGQQMDALSLQALTGGRKALPQIGAALSGQAADERSAIPGVVQGRLRMAMEREQNKSLDSYRNAQLGLQRDQLAETRRSNMANEGAKASDVFAPFNPTSGEALYNRRTGETVPGAGGAPMAGAAPGAALPNLKLTEQQSKAFAAANRMREARRIMDEVGHDPGYWSAAATGTVKGPISNRIPQGAASAKGQRYFTAGRHIIGAILRKESGAAINESEWVDYGPLFIPMPWDKPQTVKDKLAILDTIEKSLALETGPQGAAYLQSQLRAPPPGDASASASPAGSAPATGERTFKRVNGKLVEVVQ